MKSFSMSFACLLENHPIYLQTVELPWKERQHMNRKDEDKFVDQEKTQKKNTMTKECIFTALLILMEQKTYEEITITEIAKRAGVSRMSYYRLYRSKDDILIQHFNEIFAELLNEIKNTEGISKYQFSLLIFQQAKENERLLKAVLRAKLYEMVLKCFIQYCSYLVEKIFGQDQGLDPVTADYLIYEEAGRFSLLLLRWVERGMKESPEKMAKMMEQIEVNLTK